MQRTILRGADNIRFLDSQGITFTLPYGRSKKAMPEGWNLPGAGVGADKAIAHFERNNNVGALAEHVIIIDIDFNFPDKVATLGNLAHTAKVWRNNAKERGALLYRVTDGPVRTATWKPEGTTEPHAELKAQARTGNYQQKNIAGWHNGGEYLIVDAQYGIREITSADLSLIWLIITGEELHAPKPAKTHAAKPIERKATNANDNLPAQVKAHWTTLAVFEHHGWVKNGTEQDRSGETRILGHGGLLCKDDVWHSFADDKGGDAIDAWAHCTRRDRDLFFRDILHEMADVAGISYVVHNPQQAEGIDHAARFRRQIAKLSHLVKSVSFAPFISAELKCSRGYRTDSTDTKVAAALLKKAKERGSFRFFASLEELRTATGLGSRDTIANALTRLEGWFVTIEKGSDSKANFYQIDAEVVTRTLDTNSHLIDIDELFIDSDGVSDLHATKYEEHLSDDPFVSGCSKHMRTAIEENDNGHRSATWKVRDALALGLVAPSLGETILRLIDALEEHGDMTRAEMQEETGKASSAIATATRRGVELGILEEEQEQPRAPKVYRLMPDAWERIDELAPGMTTYLLGTERAERGQEAIQRNAESKLAAAKHGKYQLDQEQKTQLERTAGRAAARRRPLLAKLHPDWSDEEIDRWVNASTLKVNMRQRVGMEAKHERLRAEARREIRQQIYTDERQRLSEEVQRLRGDGLGRQEMRRYLLSAGWTEEDMRYVGLDTPQVVITTPISPEQYRAYDAAQRPLHGGGWWRHKSERQIAREILRSQSELAMAAG